MKESLLNFFVETTGQLRAKLEQDTDRDIYMTAQQALEYGLIDSVLNKPA